LIDEIKKLGFDFSSDEDRDGIWRNDSKTELKKSKYQLAILDTGRD